ncbi:unnamed protein product [Cuscuta europaea]|uniref:Pectinesterase inhibitor domain-containing protein n=1 Tax=Cuscuta europaea TaxID=41803 RepID=A0A9P1DY74_CUSEU|nr:unnamed protein product [Cuscuta europaea]
MAAKQTSFMVILVGYSLTALALLAGAAAGRGSPPYAQDCMRQKEEPKLLAQDAIALGIQEVKAVKGFVGKLVNLKSLQFPENAVGLSTCADGVAENLSELSSRLNRLRRAPLTVSYSWPPLKFALGRAVASADACRTAIGHVDAAFVDMLMRKLNDLSLILDDVVHRVSKLDDATQN